MRRERIGQVELSFGYASAVVLFDGELRRESPGWRASSQSVSARLSLLRLARSPEYRLCGWSLRTAMPRAFFCPIRTSSDCPMRLSFEQAGALPLVTTTDAQLIERAVKPRAGQTVLVTGALGGVGRTAVHVARKHGARVLAGVRAKDKEEASKLKVDGVVAINSEEEIERLRDLDAIADTAGGTTIQRLLKTIRKGGVLGSVLGEPEGAQKYDIRVEAFMAQPDVSRLHQLADDVVRHEFSIPIARTMKLQEIQGAHRIFERGGLSGKIVLVP
jgi:NADPH:quinone reductase-like Zn-dependent oxidoreductase